MTLSSTTPDRALSGTTKDRGTTKERALSGTTKERALSGTTILGKSSPGSDGNEGVLCILQISCITETSPSDCLVSYLGHSMGKSYPSAEMQPLSQLTGSIIFVGMLMCIYTLIHKYIKAKLCMYKS